MTTEPKWLPISTAPRDGTKVTLTWVKDGKPQEIYPGMVWNRFAENKLFQYGRGIWAYHDKRTGQILQTWTEEGGNGPTHWARYTEGEPVDFDALDAMPVEAA
jgi:hypothetical protein